MTKTDPALCTRTPTTEFKTPVMARRIAAKFSAMEKARFHRMVRIIFASFAADAAAL